MYIEISLKQFVFHIFLVFTFLEKIQCQSEHYYLKIVFVVDYETYVFYSGNITKCEQLAQEIVTGAAYHMKTHNIFISLEDTVVLTTPNDIPEETNPGGLLVKMIEYKSTNNLFTSIYKNYSMVFLTKRVLQYSVAGVTRMATACSRKSSVIVVAWRPAPDAIAFNLAHEMGHSVSMLHDTNKCSCPYDKCLMTAYYLYNSFDTVGWSNCSFHSFENFKKLARSKCLTIPPDQDETSYCGDGIVQSDEQCDCGPKSVSCQCCNAQTCTLTSNAACGSGPCCNLTTCNYIEASSQTVCRKAADYACDFDEYCNGESRFCPEDRTIHDGVRCASDGFCYKGKCGSPGAYCSYLYQADLKKGNLLCFHPNSHDINNYPCGSNGFNSLGFLCNHADIECGRLSCSNNESVVLTNSSVLWVNDIPSIHSETSLRETEQCVIIISSNNLPRDFGLTPNGAVCGFDYLGICIDTKCIPVNKIINENACPGNCNGHGVCDNFGQCHCDAGFNSPNCS